MADPTRRDSRIDLTAQIVGAYVSKNEIDSDGLAGLIGAVHSALNRTSTGAAEPQRGTPSPAVPIRKSIAPDYIVCLEDGQKFKSMKRHLQRHHNLTPDEYRQKWALPKDYPMVAPNYAETRSNLAKQMGLGQRRAGGR
jgi:predicted transcriptional regulator